MLPIPGVLGFKCDCWKCDHWSLNARLTAVPACTTSLRQLPPEDVKTLLELADSDSDGRISLKASCTSACSSRIDCSDCMVAVDYGSPCQGGRGKGRGRLSEPHDMLCISLPGFVLGLSMNCWPVEHELLACLLPGVCSWLGISTGAGSCNHGCGGRSPPSCNANKSPPPKGHAIAGTCGNLDCSRQRATLQEPVSRSERPLALLLTCRSLA